MEIQIEKMTISDLEHIKDFLISDFDDFWNYNILKSEISSENSIYFISKDLDGTITGFAGVQFIMDEANITNIVTRKSYRNNGIGSKLLQKLISYSKEQNMSSITLEVNENNVYALALYNKYNFENKGIRKKYYNGTDNAIIMTLNLNN